MKRTGFKQQSIEEIKEKQAIKREKLLILKKSIKAPIKSVLGRSQGIKKPPLTPYKKRLKKIKAELPKWLKAIPESTSHGSGTHEKRLWKITSDYVRIRDWYKYNQVSVDGKWLETWQRGQAGHYISYSVCKNMFKFDKGNIHLQSANSNQLSSASDGHKFGKEINKRYGENFCDNLEKRNLEHANLMYTNEDVIYKIYELMIAFQDLEERPEYVRKAFELRQSQLSLSKHLHIN